MGILKSNSSSAAASLNSDIAAEIAAPKRIFAYLNMGPAQAQLAAKRAAKAGNWHKLALIALSQMGN